MKRTLIAAFVVIICGCILVPQVQAADYLLDNYGIENKNDESRICCVHPTASIYSAMGQSFEGNNKPTTACEFGLRRDGSPGRLIARLYLATGTIGVNARPIGTPLDSSLPIEATSISSSGEIVRFTGFQGYVTEPGKNYCIVAECLDGLWNLANSVSFAIDTSSPTHVGNRCHYKYNKWYADAYDVIFYLYTDEETEPPETTVGYSRDWIYAINNWGGLCNIVIHEGVTHFFFSYVATDYNVSHATIDSISGSNIVLDPSNPVINVNIGHGGHSVLIDPRSHEAISFSEQQLGIGTSTELRHWAIASHGAADTSKIYLYYKPLSEHLQGVWSLWSDTPIISCSSGDWDSYNVGWNGLIFFWNPLNGKVTILYEGYGPDLNYNYSVGKATLENGVWLKSYSNPVLTQEPGSSRRTVPNDIWLKDGVWILVYTDIIPPSTGEQLCKAYSSDPSINIWYRDENNPIESPTPEEISISDFSIYMDYENNKEWIYYEKGNGLSRMWCYIEDPPELPPPTITDGYYWAIIIGSSEWEIVKIDGEQVFRFNTTTIYSIDDIIILGDKLEI